MLDTGPLFLLLVGQYDESYIDRVSRLKNMYDVGHFHLLVQFLTGRRVIITPGVLAEAMSFAKKIPQKRFGEMIEADMDTLRELGEIHVPKNDTFSRAELMYLGYTDVSLLIAAEMQNGEILTEDWKLHTRCRQLGVEATHMISIKDIASTFT